MSDGISTMDLTVSHKPGTRGVKVVLYRFRPSPPLTLTELMEIMAAWDIDIVESIYEGLSESARGHLVRHEKIEEVGE